MIPSISFQNHNIVKSDKRDFSDQFGIRVDTGECLEIMMMVEPAMSWHIQKSIDEWRIQRESHILSILVDLYNNRSLTPWQYVPRILAVLKNRY